MFTVVACHRCSSLFRPGPRESGVPGLSRQSVLTNGRRLCPECCRVLGDPPEQPRFSSPRGQQVGGWQAAGRQVGGWQAGGWQAADTFSGETRRLVTALKYRNDTAAVAVLADQLVSAIRADQVNADRVDVHSRGLRGALRPGFDVVTWAPTSARRRKRRGYDQSELLARAVARRMGLPCRRLLVRDRSRHQTGRSRQERIENGPEFTARPLRRPSRVLVIDDVVTTGSTLRAAGHALDLAGAAKVVLFAAASTPDASPPRFRSLHTPTQPTSESASQSVTRGRRRRVRGLQVA